MNLIDHRILIPTSPERVWHFVGDLKRNSEWQANCRSTTMLTSNTKIQPGARLRVVPDRGREFVIEITAWYDRFGYEYTVVEGGPYRDNKGTVRLQEVPEGTIVQWTFSYRTGMFGGGAARGQESIIVDSLRSLYRLITKSKEVETFQAKSLMRDDPGVEARATYRPRHPFGDTAEGSASLVKGKPRQPTRPQAPVTFDEPPVSPEDTKPRPVVAPAASAAPAAAPVEPDFLAAEPSTPAVIVESQSPSAPAVSPEPATSMPADVPAVPPSVELPAAAAKVSQSPDAAPPAQVPAAAEIAESDLPAQPVQPAAEVSPVAVPPVDPLEDTAAPRTSDTAPIVAQYATPSEAPVAAVPSGVKRDRLSDTSRISVFEVFGLPKPSETQELETYSKEQLERPEPISFTRPEPPRPIAVVPRPVEVQPVRIDAAPLTPVAKKRGGHRLYMRARTVNVRRTY